MGLAIVKTYLTKHLKNGLTGVKELALEGVEKLDTDGVIVFVVSDGIFWAVNRRDAA
jgi:hypothetical protein